MALARIFSRYPEQTMALSQQLQQQGYKVEVLSPEEAPASLADLEIQLEVCDPQDVLRRAAELAARLHADIAVAPGALQAGPSPAQAADEPSRPEAPAAPASPAGPEPATAPPIPVGSQVARAAQEQEEEAGAVSTSLLLRSGRAFGAVLAACAAAAGELPASARDRFREQLERARVRAAEARALRQQRLLELTRRRAEAQQHAVELESARRAAAAYLLQLQREYPDALPDSRRRLTGPGPAEGAAPDAGPPARAWRMKIRRIHTRRWEAVLAGVASAAALFVIGLAVASFHSRPAGSGSRGVTVQSGGVTLHGAQAKPASPARPSPAVRTATQKPAAARAHQIQRKLPQRNQDAVANDVVVRHFPAPKPAQQDGWKHFSDLSN